MANPVENEYLSFQDRKLSNAVPLVEFRRRKVVVHILNYSRWFQATAIVLDLWKAVTFFVLRSIRVKFHIRTRLIESFPTTYWLWWCAEEKWYFAPLHTLRQLKRDEAICPPLLISLADRNGLKNFPRQIFVRV